MDSEFSADFDEDIITLTMTNPKSLKFYVTKHFTVGMIKKMLIKESVGIDSYGYGDDMELTFQGLRTICDS